MNIFKWNRTALILCVFTTKEFARQSRDKNDAISFDGSLLSLEAIRQVNIAPPPTLSTKHKNLLIESWHYVEDHVTEVIYTFLCKFMGITKYFNLIK